MPHFRKEKIKQTALLYKVLALFLFFITINTIWFCFFSSDESITIIYGILTPLLYCIFYYFIKKTRKKIKTKIKSHIYIPITYAIFGLFWYCLTTFLIFISNKLDGKQDGKIVKTQVVNLTIVTNYINLNDNKNVLEKLNVNTFFLFNPNLAFPCNLVKEFESKLDNKQTSKGSNIHISKQKTNNLIIFILLFIIQILAIYTSENFIYPKIKPLNINKVKKRKKYSFLKVDEANLFVNNETNKNQKKFPQL